MALDLNFADLKLGLCVRVVGNVSHNGLSVGPEGGLKRFHRIEEQMEHGDIGGA